MKVPVHVPDGSVATARDGHTSRWRARLTRWRAFGAVLRRFAPYARARGRGLATAAGLAVVYMVVRLVEPWPLKLIFDHLLLAAPLPGWLQPLAALAGTDRTPLLGLCVTAILLVAVVSGLAYYRYNVLTAQLGNEVVSELRYDLYQHIQRLSFSFHDRRRTGDLLVRLTSDIRILRDAFVSLPMQAVEEGLVMVGMAVVMLAVDWQLAIPALLLPPAIVPLVRRYRRPMREAIRQQRRREGDLASVAADALGAIKVVQGFRLERQELARFGGANSRSLRQGVRAARLEAKLKWASEVAVGLVTALVVGLAVRRIHSGAFTPGELIVFVSYLRSFARPLRRISRTTEQITRTTTAGERILDILSTEPDVMDRLGAVAAPTFRGVIHFDHVSFAYPSGAVVLAAVDLRIAAGERVAIVGATGAGKSTLVSLVPRFYDPTAGCVRIDGHDIRTLTLASLRDQVSLVFQDPVLFPTSIAANIAMGRPGATMDDVVTAARSAGIDEVIRRLPAGYDTVLGERGGTLSGGQRQCVTIARALIRNTPIVILDEPTTGLDARACALVVEALHRLVDGRTVLLISHDLPKLGRLDRIVVLDRGRIVKGGTAVFRGEPPPVTAAAEGAHMVPRVAVR